MDKIPETTPDLASENVAKLLKLFPECASERGEVDIEKLKQELADHALEGDVKRRLICWILFVRRTMFARSARSGFGGRGRRLWM